MTWGCGQKNISLQKPDSRGYILYVFAKKTEVLIDVNDRDGVSRGMKLDVFRMNVPNMDEPVKLGEISVQKVGSKMSRAKVTAITSSLPMKPGDRVFPHRFLIVSDSSWLASRTLKEGWKSDHSLSDKRYWKPCEVLDVRRIRTKPEMNQFLAETHAKPIWYPSISSRHGEVFFRKVFQLNTSPVVAELTVICGGKTNIYLNDIWVGEAKKWPEISVFRVQTHLRRGKNLIAVHTVRDPHSVDPPVLFLGLSILTQFQR